MASRRVGLRWCLLRDLGDLRLGCGSCLLGQFTARVYADGVSYQVEITYAISRWQMLSRISSVG